MMSDNLRVYNLVREVPAEAKKSIQGGRLKGMTDINPMWRIKMLTERFGLVGVGWYYEITEKRMENGANNEIAAFVDINLYIKDGEGWSKPICGTGGSSFVASERNGLYTSDECFKMALTDAISVSCKAIGIGADVYWGSDPTKYSGVLGLTDKEVEASLEELNIIEGIELIDTIPSLGDYFQKHKNAFKNQKNFIEACSARKKNLMDDENI